MELLSIPAILAIVEALKLAGVPSKYAPLISIILGIIAGLLVVEMTIDGGIMGLVLGLGASGLYDNAKPALTKLGVR